MIHVKENPKIHMRTTTIHRLYVVFRNLIFQASSRIQAASFFRPASWGVGASGRSPGKFGNQPKFLHGDGWKWGNTLRRLTKNMNKTWQNDEKPVRNMAEWYGEMVAKPWKVMGKSGKRTGNHWILRFPNFRSKANVAKIIISDPKAAWCEQSCVRNRICIPP